MVDPSDPNMVNLPVSLVAIGRAIARIFVMVGKLEKAAFLGEGVIDHDLSGSSPEKSH